MLKVCLVGVGGISGAHIPAWEAMEDVELTGLCDIRPEQMKAYENKHCYTDYKEMLEKEQPDILDICLPTYLHADTAVYALEKGIHVLCEKPVSLKPEDAERVYAAAKAHHVCFMVAQVLRFWPEYEFVKEIYDSGKYGKLLSGSMTRLGVKPKWSWDRWMFDENRSGLVPFDLHIHDLDFMVYAFGAPKKADTYRARRPDQDVLTALYTFDGFYLHSEAAWYKAEFPFQARFRFQFEEALVVLEDSLRIYQADGTVLSIDGDNAETGGIALPKTNAYANEIRYFTDCVKQHVPADKVKPEELKAVIDILKSF